MLFFSKALLRAFMARDFGFGYDASKSFNKFFDAHGDRDASSSMETRLHNDVGSFENDQ